MASSVIISDMELDHILNSLRTSSLENVGDKGWMTQMSSLEEINVQAALEADIGVEERVREALVGRDKLKLVVRELVLIEVWREKILAEILGMGTPKTSIQVRFSSAVVLFFFWSNAPS